MPPLGMAPRPWPQALPHARRLPTDPSRARGAKTGYESWVSETAGHQQVDHTGDLALRFWAPTEATLLAEGARAVIEVLTAKVEVSRADTRQLSIDSLDDEDRLVRWLNEVLLLATVDGFVLAEAEVHLRPGGLEATLRGQADALELIRTEIKSVTYHGVQLAREDRRVVGQVVVDL